MPPPTGLSGQPTILRQLRPHRGVLDRDLDADADTGRQVPQERGGASGGSDSNQAM